MSDPLGKITEGKDIIGKIRNFLSGFIGYVDRETRRDADKLLRGTVAQRYEEQWSKVSELQRQLIAAAQLKYVDDLEAAAIKLRTFADRINASTYGYSGFFDAVQVNKDELEKMYAFDLALLEGVDEIVRAVDNVETSIGGDGIEAAISHLVSQSQAAIDTYNRREEVILES
jgi:hypothetical protein